MSANRRNSYTYLLQRLLFACVNKIPTDVQNFSHLIRNEPLEISSQTLILYQCYLTSGIPQGGTQCKRV